MAGFEVIGDNEAKNQQRLTMPEETTPAELTLQSLWSLLSPEEQHDACVCFWTGKSPLVIEPREQVISRLAKLRNFRERFVRERPLEWKVRELHHWLHEPPLADYLANVIREYLVERKSPMICAILDGEGTPHNGIWITEDAPNGTSDSFIRGLVAVRNQYRDRDLLLYYGVHFLAGVGDHWDGLQRAFEAKEFAELQQSVLSRHPSTTATAAPEASPAESESEEPEASDDFTTLDSVLIKTVVASAIGADGALMPDALEDLVQEVVTLSAERHRSYFHLGYLDAVLNREFRPDFPGSNAIRRAWNVTGYLMGRMRAAGGREIATWIKSNRKSWDELMAGGPMSGRVMLLPHIMERLCEAGEWGLVTGLLASCNLPKDKDKAVNIFLNAYEAASSLIRRGNAAEAIPLLLQVLWHAENSPRLPDSFKSAMWPTATRKLGQAHLRMGNFVQAKELLNKALAAGDFDEAANARTDLGLTEAGFRSLDFVLPREDVTVDETVIAALEAQIQHFKDATSCPGQSTNANFVLSLISVHRNRMAEAETFLSRALAGMLEKEEAYLAGNLLDWVRFLLAIVIAEQCEPARLNEVRQLMEAAISTPAVFPLRLWAKFSRAAALYDDKSLSETAIAYLLAERGDPAYELLKDSGLLRRNGKLRARYREWLDSRSLAPLERGYELQALLDSALNEGNLDEASEILDQLEGVAKTESEYGMKFVEFLRKRRAALLAVWEESDLQYVEASLLERFGHLDECAAILQQLFFRYRADGDVAEAEALLAQMEHLGRPCVDVDALQSSIAHLKESEPEPEGNGDTIAGVRVLYVGGDETQAQYENEIRRRVAIEHPGLSMSFCFPGWSSGWNVILKRLLPIIRQNDVVVINRLVRTHLGRNLRAECDGNPPWRSCTGRGRDSIQRSILGAAKWVSAIKNNK